MSILLTGIDGYMGWPAALRLANAHPNETIIGIDNGARRHWVHEVGSWSAVPIWSMPDRLDAFQRVFRRENIVYRHLDLCDYSTVRDLLEEYQPHTIVHLAAQPSAPYSMLSPRKALYTQMNNLESTLNLIQAAVKVTPDVHFIETTTMGVYGTPSLDIPDGYAKMEYKGKKDNVPFPLQAGSWYHWSKVHDANNLLFAHRVHKLNITDLRVGIVYGTSTQDTEKDIRLATRFDFDFWFGVLFNRFLAQALVGYPLTIYGKGGQTRTYIGLEDMTSTIQKAVEKPAKQEHRVINTFTEKASVRDVAEKVQQAGDRLGKKFQIQTIKNPRVEMEEHYYNPTNEKLRKIGVKRSINIAQGAHTILKILDKNKTRVMTKKDKFLPKHIQ